MNDSEAKNIADAIKESRTTERVVCIITSHPVDAGSMGKIRSLLGDTGIERLHFKTATAINLSPEILAGCYECLFLLCDPDSLSHQSMDVLRASTAGRGSIFRLSNGVTEKWLT